jgi:hypothetical protein
MYRDRRPADRAQQRIRIQLPEGAHNPARLNGALLNRLFKGSFYHPPLQASRKVQRSCIGIRDFGIAKPTRMRIIQFALKFVF